MKNSILDIFPLFLIRKAGENIEKLDALCVSSSLASVKELFAKRNKLMALALDISEEIYKIIRVTADKNRRNRLINLRRRIFHHEIFTEDVKYIKETNLNKKIKEYTLLLLQITELQKHIHTVYSEEEKKTQGKLEDILSGSLFQKGLLLSSLSLSKSLDDYLNSPDKKSDDPKTARSLIKYVSRMYTKTTPYSTFTHLGIGNLEDIPFTVNRFRVNQRVSASGDIKSHIRLNNSMFQYLTGLMIKHPLLRQELKLRLNSTIMLNNGTYKYLTNNFNRESFQTISPNSALDLLYQVVGTQTITYKTLVKEIIKTKKISADEEQIRSFVDALIEYGFFEYDLEVSGTDPDWDIHLVAQLSKIRDFKEAAHIIQVLKDIRHAAKTYETVDVAERKRVLLKAFDAFRALCLSLHVGARLPEEERESFEYPPKSIKPDKKDKGNAPKDEIFRHTFNTSFYLRPEQLFFEDTSFSQSFSLDPQFIQQIVDSLSKLTSVMKGFDGCNDERDRMHTFFIYHYTTGAVPLLKFYEDYYRHVKKPAEEDKDKKQDEVEKTIKRKEANDAWLKAVVNKLSDRMRSYPDEINISSDDIRREKSEYIKEDRVESYGAFMQLQKKGEKIMPVVDSIPPGFGKMYSRFLHIFDEQVTAQIQRKNEEYMGEELFAENIDASYFNANLHPPLMPYEIKVPHGHFNLPESQRIQISDIEVRREGERLALFQISTGKQISVFDLGFQGFRGRSELYGFLDKFSPGEHVSAHPLLNVINEKYKHRAVISRSDNDEKSLTSEVCSKGSLTSFEMTNKKIYIKPRVKFNNSIILQRKSWMIPVSQLPVRLPLETEADYFIRVNLWRMSLHIPDEVFVRIIPAVQKDNDKKDKKSKMGRDDYKPQYIHFGNPYLLNLFERLLHKVEGELQIEEMLPNSQELLTFGGKKYVSEFLIQWYQTARQLHE